MKKVNLSKNILQKRIPTLLGIAVLVVGLIAGTLLFSQGTGVFAPRATPQTTPKNIRVTNVTDSTFTISFLTDAATKGFVKYGETAGELSRESADDRVQLSANSDLSFTLHHITVRGLQAERTYHYVLGSGGALFDQEGVPFTVTTAKAGGTPSAAKTINGVVLNENGSPAVNSVVYVTLPGAGEMSALIRNQSGNWAVPLSDARKTDGSEFATIAETDSLSLFIQGPLSSQTTQFTTLVADAQPVETLTFGQTPTGDRSSQSLVADETKPSPSPSPSPSATPLTRATTPASTSTQSSTLSETASSSGSRANQGTTTTTGSNTETDTRQLAQVNATPTPTPTPRPTAAPTPSPTPSPSATPRPSATPFGSGNPFPATPSATASVSATTSGRVGLPATGSGLPVSGGVDATLVLIFGGAFFIIAGAWSFWVGTSLAKNED